MESEPHRSGDTPPAPDPAAAAVARVARELEQHVAASGWDGPVRVFALVRTAGALEREPGLAGQLPGDVVAAAAQEPDALLSVEQEDLPAAASLEELLGSIAWPPTVDGAAVVVERVVLPPEAEADMPADTDDALTWLAEHPQRDEVRLAVALLRDGPNACALRTRRHDSPAAVAVAPDLVPGLVEALAATLRA